MQEFDENVKFTKDEFLKTFKELTETAKKDGNFAEVKERFVAENNINIMTNTLFKNVEAATRFDNPFDLLKTIIPKENNIADKEHFFSSIENIFTGEKENYHKIAPKINEIANNAQSITEGLDAIKTYFNTNPLGANYNLNGKFFTNFSYLVRQCGYDIKTLDGLTKFINASENALDFNILFPNKDILKDVFKNPNEFDNHPYEEKINALIRIYNSSNEKAILNEANDIIISGDEDACSVTSSIAEKCGVQSDENKVAGIVKYLKKNGFSDDNFEATKRHVYFKNAEKTSKLYRDILNEDLLSKEYKDFLKTIASELRETGIYDPNILLVEAQTKHYSLLELAKAMNDVKSAVDEEDIEHIFNAAAKYRSLESKYDYLLEKVNKINPNEAITSNISSSRVGNVPSKYRNDFVGTSRLTGIWMAMQQCQKFNVDFDQFVDNPVQVMQSISQKYLTSNEFVSTFNKLGNDRLAWIKALTNKSLLFEQNMRISKIFEGFERMLDGIGCMISDPEANVKFNISSQIFVGQLVSQNWEISTNLAAADKKLQAQIVAKTIMVKDEDLSIFTILPDSHNTINPFTLEPNEKFDMGNYIENKLSLEELFNKLKFINLHKNEKEFAGVVDYMKETIQASEKFNSNTKSYLLDVLAGKTLDSIDKAIIDYKLLSADDDMDIDDLFVDDEELANKINNQVKKVDTDGVFENNVNMARDFLKLVYESKMLGRSSDPAIIVDEISRKREAELKVEYCALEFRKELKTYAVDLDKLGYKPGVDGVIDAMHDMVFNKDKNFAHYRCSLPNYVDYLEPRLINRMKLDLLTDYYPKTVKPEDQEKLNYIKGKVLGVTSEYKEGNRSREEAISTPTSLALSIAPIKDFLSKEGNDQYKDVFRFGSVISEYTAKKDVSKAPALAKMISEFKLSDDTKKSLISVYDKMNEYNMFIDFEPTGEEGTKKYSLHKLYNAQEEVAKALMSGNISKAYDKTLEYENVLEEYEDVFNLITEKFPQDDLHIADNLLAGRESYVPLEFANKPAPQVQASSIYNIVGMCRRYNIDFKELVNNPAEGIKTILKKSNDEKFASFNNNKNKVEACADFLSVACSSLQEIDYVIGRGIEGLITLNYNSPDYAKNGLIATIINGLNVSFSDRNDLFIKHTTNNYKNGPMEIDYESAKGFIASLGRLPVEKFLPHTINVLTGQKLGTDFNYNEFVRNDDRSIDEIFNTTIDMLAKTIIRKNMQYGINFSERDRFNMDQMLYTTAMVFNDYIVERGLINDHSIYSNMMRHFIDNPKEVLATHMEKNYANELNEINGLDESLSDFAKVKVNQNIASFTSLKTTIYSNNFAAYNDLKPLDKYNMYNNLKENGEISIDNFADALLLAKSAYDKYFNRGWFNKKFSNEASTEKNMFNDAKALAVRFGISKDEIEDFFNSDGNEANRVKEYVRLAEIQQQVKDYYPNVINKKLDTLFANNAPLDNEKLKDSIQILKEINTVKEYSKLSEQDTHNLNESIRNVKRDLASKGITPDVMLKLEQNNISIDNALKSITLGVKQEEIAVKQKEPVLNEQVVKQNENVINNNIIEKLDLSNEIDEDVEELQNDVKKQNNDPEKQKEDIVINNKK